MSAAQRLLKFHEGYSKKPYRCTAGKLSIGHGRNLDDVGIDEEEAEYLLQRDIDRAIVHLRLEPYWLDLSENRQAVIIDMCVNMGWTRFSRFVKLREALFQKDYAEACRQMVQSEWYKQVKRRGPLLVDVMADDQIPSWVPGR